jgi:hypothetical protein
VETRLKVLFWALRVVELVLALLGLVLAQLLEHLGRLFLKLLLRLLALFLGLLRQRLALLLQHRLGFQKWLVKSERL